MAARELTQFSRQFYEQKCQEGQLDKLKLEDWKPDLEPKMHGLILFHQLTKNAGDMDLRTGGLENVKAVRVLQEKDGTVRLEFVLIGRPAALLAAKAEEARKKAVDAAFQANVQALREKLTQAVALSPYGLLRVMEMALDWALKPESEKKAEEHRPHHRPRNQKHRPPPDMSATTPRR